MLYTISHHRVPGVVQAIRDDVVKRIYIKDGNVVHASSSDIRDSLGYYLLHNGLISKQEFRTTMRTRRSFEGRYGVVVVERGVLSPADLYRAIRLQNEEIIWSLFSWEQGQVTFSIGEFHDPSVTPIQIPMRQAIKKGVKRAPNAKGLLARVGRKDSILEAHFRTDDLIEVALSGQEYELLRLVDGKRTLLELCTEGPLSSIENGKLLYAFYVLQFVSIVDEHSRSIKIRLRTEGDQFTS
jgi:hypothetical protein